MGVRRRRKQVKRAHRQDSTVKRAAVVAERLGEIEVMAWWCNDPECLGSHPARPQRPGARTHGRGPG